VRPLVVGAAQSACQEVVPLGNRKRALAPILADCPMPVVKELFMVTRSLGGGVVGTKV